MKKILLITLLSLSLASAFGAEEKVNVCKEDALKFCQGMTSVHHLPKCLREHIKDLALECKKVIEETHKTAQDKYKSCREDLNKLCKTAPKKLKCLQDNHAKLSASCQVKIQK